MKSAGNAIRQMMVPTSLLTPSASPRAVPRKPAQMTNDEYVELYRDRTIVHRGACTFDHHAYALALHGAKERILENYMMRRPEADSKCAKGETLQLDEKMISVKKDGPPSLCNLSQWSENRRTEMRERLDRKSTRLNSSHSSISYAVFCFK